MTQSKNVLSAATVTALVSAASLLAADAPTIASVILFALSGLGVIAAGRAVSRADDTRRARRVLASPAACLIAALGVVLSILADRSDVAADYLLPGSLFAFSVALAIFREGLLMPSDFPARRLDRKSQAPAAGLSAGHLQSAIILVAALARVAARHNSDARTLASGLCAILILVTLWTRRVR